MTNGASRKRLLLISHTKLFVQSQKPTVGVGQSYRWKWEMKPCLNPKLSQPKQGRNRERNRVASHFHPGERKHVKVRAERAGRFEMNTCHLEVLSVWLGTLNLNFTVGELETFRCFWEEWATPSLHGWSPQEPPTGSTWLKATNWDTPLPFGSNLGNLANSYLSCWCVWRF